MTGRATTAAVPPNSRRRQGSAATRCSNQTRPNLTLTDRVRRSDLPQRPSLTVLHLVCIQKMRAWRLAVSWPYRAGPASPALGDEPPPTNVARPAASVILGTNKLNAAWKSPTRCVNQVPTCSVSSVSTSRVVDGGGVYGLCFWRSQPWWRIERSTLARGLGRRHIYGEPGVLPVPNGASRYLVRLGVRRPFCL